MGTPQPPFTTLSEAQVYVRAQLTQRLPAGWAALWTGPTDEPLPAVGSWRIARYDAHLGTWQGSDEYTLLLTTDFTTFVLTHSNRLPGMPPREAIATTTAALLPVRSLTGVSLGAVIAYALRTYPPNVYDLT